MTEIELKFKIDSAEDFSKKLRDLNFAMVRPRIYDKTIMFDNKNELMQTTDGRVRLRISEGKNEISYKKPITREGIKKEIEYETTVEDADVMEKILETMGFYSVSSYERFRTEFSHNNVKITIDEYPFASFIELEGDEDAIIFLAEELGFNVGENITKSCDTLFSEWRGRKGLAAVQHMTFDEYDK